MNLHMKAWVTALSVTNLSPFGWLPQLPHVIAQAAACDCPSCPTWLPFAPFLLSFCNRHCKPAGVQGLMRLKKKVPKEREKKKEYVRQPTYAQLSDQQIDSVRERGGEKLWIKFKNEVYKWIIVGAQIRQTQWSHWQDQNEICQDVFKGSAAEII